MTVQTPGPDAAAPASTATATTAAATTTTIHAIQQEEQDSGGGGKPAAALPEALECALPPGIAIQRNAYGHGLFATQDFAEGAMLYVTSCLYVPDVIGTITLRIAGTGQEFTLDMKEHSVVQSDKPGLRQLYTFDAYMNHACEPNTGSVVTAVDEERLEYGMKALRPIKAGEELSCDYTLFEYEAGEAGILQCQCGAGAGRCLGSVVGFKYLDLARAAPRFAHAEPYVITSYLKDHAGMAFVDLRSQQQGAASLACAVAGGEPLAVRAHLDGTGAKTVQAGAIVAEVIIQHFAGPSAEARQLVIAPSASPSFAVAPRSAVLAGAGAGDEWPLRAAFQGDGKSEANIRTERVERGEEGEEGQALYRLVALRDIKDGESLVVA